jgi:hypothetical protein
MIEKYIKYCFISGIVYLVLFLIATIYQSTLWCDILSPLGTLFSFFILLFVYKKAERIKSIWIILSLSALIWTFTDILWGIYE